MPAKRFLFLLFCLIISLQLNAIDSCRVRLRAGFAAINSCPNQDIGLCNTSRFIPDKTFFSWTFGDGRSSDSLQPFISYKEGNRLYRIQLLVYEKNSVCRDSVYGYLEIFPQPDSRFGNLIQLIDNQPYRLLTAYNCSPSDHMFNWYLPGADTLHVIGTNSLLLKDTFKGTNLQIGLKVTRNDGCSSFSQKDFTLVSVPEYALNEMKIYTDGLGRIHLDKIPAECQFSIQNTEGQILRSGKLQSDEQVIETTERGLLFLSILFPDGSVQTSKVLVE